jgi:hypothetical protein
MAIASQVSPITEDISGWLGSIGQYVFVVRGRIDIGTGLVGVWTRHALRRRSGRRVVDEGDDAHRVLADETAEGSSREKEQKPQNHQTAHGCLAGSP